MADLDKLTLEFDDGLEEECSIIGVFVCDGTEYIALEGKGDEVYLYLYIEDGKGGFELKDIPDADYDRVGEAFDRLMEQLQ